MSPEQFQTLLRAAIEELESPHLRSELLSGLITPVRERWTFWTGTETGQGDVWLFFIIPSRPSVGLAYSDDGYSELGRRWGLVFVHGGHYGDTDSWYESLSDLLVDSGYFDTSSTSDV